MLDDGLGKLPEHTIHVSALAGPHALQEADVAPVTGDQEGQVRVLLHRLHWNGWRGQKNYQMQSNNKKVGALSTWRNRQW